MMMEGQPINIPRMMYPLVGLKPHEHDRRQSVDVLGNTHRGMVDVSLMVTKADEEDEES